MKTAIVNIVLASLETASIPTLFLRGSDSMSRAEGDLDFLVPHGKARSACREVVESARSQGWYLLLFRDIGYLASIVMVRPSEHTEDLTIKIDFFSGLEWYGVGSGEISNRFFSKVLPDALSTTEQASLAATVNLLQKCLTVGKLSSRDCARVRDGGATTEQIMSVASKLGLELTAENIESGMLSTKEKWRLRAASSGYSSRLAKLYWATSILQAHLRFKFKIGFSSGQLFGFSGLDGSGKSTQLDRLLTAFKFAGDVQPKTVHLLPSWIPLPHQIFKRKSTVLNYTKPYAEPPVKSRLSAMLRLSYYLLAFTCAKLAMKLLTRRGFVIFMDRSFVDFCSDLSRARIPRINIGTTMLKWCAPSGQLLYIDASPETVVKRKGELTLEKATELRGRYFDVIKKFHGHIVDGDGSQTEVFTLILEQIDAIYRCRLGLATRLPAA